MTQDYRNLYRVQMSNARSAASAPSHVCVQVPGQSLTSVLPRHTRQPTFELRPRATYARQLDSTGKKATA